MHFELVDRRSSVPTSGRNLAYLRIDHWNDYSFVTMFDVVLFDADGTSHDLGAVKIGFAGQTTETSTFSTLPPRFQELPPGYFSLGQDVEYYEKLGKLVDEITRDAFLTGLFDMVYSEESRLLAAGEPVLKTSLLRSISVTMIDGQFRRVLAGGTQLHDFNFEFARPSAGKMAGLDLGFVVKAGSKPSTNVHALIGRNGVGKTTLLNQMIDAIVGSSEETAFFDRASFYRTPIRSDFFSSLVSVAFSAFDPFNPPADRQDPELGTRYSYIGLKEANSLANTLKTLDTLRSECVKSLALCFMEKGRKRRWIAAIETLESDDNFAAMQLTHFDLPHRRVRLEC